MMSRLRYLGLKWRAMALLVMERRESALEVFRQMLAEFPGDEYALASIAHLQAQMGQRQAALRTMEELLRVAPQVGRHWFNHGFMLEEWHDARPVDLGAEETAMHAGGLRTPSAGSAARTARARSSSSG